MSKEPQEWIVDGAEVAVVTGVGNRQQIEFVKVERTTRTIAQLDDGRRFQRYGDCYEIGKGRTATLGRATDPNVVTAYARQVLDALIHNADRMAHGSGAILYKMSAADVCSYLTELAAEIQRVHQDVSLRHESQRL